MADTEQREPTIAHDLVTLAAAVIVVIGMQQLATNLVPVLTAIFLLLAFLPLVGWLQRSGVSPGWSKLIVIALAGVALLGFVAIVGVSLAQLAENLPEYEEQLRDRIDGLTAWLAENGIDVSGEDMGGELDAGTVISVGTRVLPGIITALGATVLALVMFVYALFDAERMHNRLIRGLGPDHPQLGQLSRMVSVVSRYIAIRAVLGGAAAVLDTLLLLVLGVDYALLWGFVAFVMSFIPYVGYWASVIPPPLLALATGGWVTALLVFIGYFAINGAIDNLLGPPLMGRGLDVAPVVAVFSIVFWGFVLGPMGAFLAMPLTIAFKLLLLERSPNSRWLALLMSRGDGTIDVIRSGRASP